MFETILLTPLVLLFISALIYQTVLSSCRPLLLVRNRAIDRSQPGLTAAKLDLVNNLRYPASPVINILFARLYPATQEAAKPTGPPHPPSNLAETRPSPRDPKSWLARARTANTLEDALLYLNRALTLDPHHSQAGRKMDQALQHLLKYNAFLGYINETDWLYHVQTGAKLILKVPKDRVVPEPYPSPKPSPLQPAFRWLGIALLGLPLAGIGTLISLLIVVIYAIQAHRQSLSQADQVRVNVILAGSFGLAGLASILALLLILHL